MYMLVIILLTTRQGTFLLHKIAYRYFWTCDQGNLKSPSVCVCVFFGGERGGMSEGVQRSDRILQA